MKILTFSFDDGVQQDRRLVELMNKYNVKGTFNINSKYLGTKFSREESGILLCHDKIFPEEVKTLYVGHEVAAHTLTHQNLTTLSDERVIYEVEQDRLKLSELVGYEVVGFAYPCGGVNNDDRVANLIKNNTGVKYARVIERQRDFNPQPNIYRYKPTCSHLETDWLYSLWEKFLVSNSKEKQIFYIFGHSYALDLPDGWEKFEAFLKHVSNNKDVQYLTNREAFGF